MVSLRLLDGFDLLVGDQQVPIIPSSQRLLAYLALHGGSVTRAALAATLWPGAPGRRAAACLRSALWRLVTPPHVLIVGTRETLRIGPAVEVDITAVRGLVADLADPAVNALDLPVPVTSLSTDLLPGWTDDWVVAEREWFRQVCLRALEMLSEWFRIQGDHFHAHETAVAAVRGDPLRESAHRRLIELHLADGNPAAALLQYTSYQSRLHTELGLSPSPEIRQLLQPVYRNHADACPSD